MRLGITCCSLSRKGFTLLHIYDTVTRALVSPQAWDAPPPAFGCADQPAQSTSLLRQPASPVTLALADPAVLHANCSSYSSHCCYPLHDFACCRMKARLSTRFHSSKRRQLVCPVVL